MCNEKTAMSKKSGFRRRFSVYTIELDFDGISKEQSDFLSFAFGEDSIKPLSSVTLQFLYNMRLPQIESGSLDAFHLGHESLFYIDTETVYVEMHKRGKAIWNYNKRVFIYDSLFIDNIRHWFMLTVLDPLSIFSVKSGIIVFHGALLSVNDSAIAILGESGSGKSTLSFLLRDHYYIQSDDVFAVAQCNNQFYTIPINLGFGVPNSQKVDSDLREENNVLFKTSNKTYIKSIYSPKTKKQQNRSKLKGIIILSSKDKCSTRSIVLNHAESIMSILNLQTSIKYGNLEEKYSLIKDIVSNCKVTLVQYDRICDPTFISKTIEDTIR